MDYFKNAVSEGYEYLIKGRFTFADNQKFKEILDESRNLTSKTKVLVLDLGETEFMDSSAIGMLLLANDEAKKHNKQIILKNLTGQPRKIFEISKLYNVFNIV